jgi:hypothetical protein
MPVFTLFENEEYIVDFQGNLSVSQLNELTINYQSVLKPLHGSFYMINYGNFVGITNFCGTEYQVKSRKISENHLKEMLSFISKTMATLPFHDVAPTRIKVKDNLKYEAIFYHNWNGLRQAFFKDWDGANLQEWWLLIKQEPHQKLEDQIKSTPYWMAKQIEEKSIDFILKTPDTWFQLGKSHSLYDSKLAQKLRIEGGRYLPSIIEQNEKVISYDTPANRMLKYILTELHELTIEMERRLKKRFFFNHLQIKIENDQMNQKLEEYIDQEWMTHVGNPTHVPSFSTVLQRKNGYRQWYSFYQKILLGSNYPLPHEDITALVEGRNIAKIYEYWCFFTVIDLVEKITENKPYTFKRIINQDGYEKLKEGLQVSFSLNKKPLHIFYNRTFSKNRGSYSQSYAPDISILWEKQWYHFDAKFKFSLKNNDEKSYKTVKKEDIDKMHTYKDAIIDTKGVWVLFPNEQDEYYVFYQDPREEKSSGIGAIGIIPGEEKVLYRILKDILI